MNKTDLKQLEDLLEKKLDEKFDQKLKPIQLTLDQHSQNFVDESDKLDSLTKDMIDVQKKTDIIADIHSLVEDTREEVKEHDQRLKALESTAA